MKKAFILFGLLVSLSVLGYGHPAHRKITAKLPDILRDHGFESAAHFIWDGIYNAHRYPLTANSDNGVWLIGYRVWI